MKKFFLAFAAMLMAFSVSAAELNIYASGLKAGEVKDGKVEISYLLNATATALEVQLIGADNAVAKAFPLTGDDLAKGAHKVTVDLADVAAGTYTWAIKASAAERSAAEAVVAGDDPMYTYYHPRGVEVNMFPETEYFGYVYVSEAMTKDNSQRSDQGIYIYSPLLDNPYNQTTGTTGAFDGGVAWEYTGTTVGGPRRLALGEDGYLYISANNANNSGVWRMDPANPSANFVEVLAQSAHGTTFGTVDAIDVKGSGENLVLYTLNNVGLNVGQLYAYAVGNQTAYTGSPTEPVGAVSASLLNALATIREDGRGGFWLAQNRGANATSGSYGFRHISSTGEVDLKGNTVLPDYDAAGNQASLARGAMALNADKSKVAVGANGKVFVFSIAYDAETGDPTLTEQYVTGAITGNIDDVAFDYAENLYVVSADSEKFYVYGTPTANVQTTPAPKANTITVEAAAAADTYVVAGSEALCGSSWNTTDENNLMTEANGVYTKVYTNVPVGKNYQLKVVKNGNNWFGDATGNNITFHIIEACDVTVTFNPATSEITVTGTGVTFPTGLEIEAIYAVGNGGAEWLNGASWDPAAAANKMAEVSPFVYQIAYTGVPAGNYEVKFAANGSWSDSWGEVGDYTISSSIEDYDAAYNGGNIKINNTFAKADITLEIDLSKFDYATKTGAKFSVTITEQAAEEQPAAPKYVKVTEAPADWAGTYILAYEVSETEANVFNGLDTEANHVAATIANGAIESEGLVELEIAAVEGGYSIQLVGGEKDGKFLGHTAYTNKITFADAAIVNTLSVEETGIKIACTVDNKGTAAEVTMRFNNATNNGNRFRYYKSGQQPVQLYKKVEPVQEPVQIRVDPMFGEYTVGDMFEVTAKFFNADSDPIELTEEQLENLTWTATTMDMETGDDIPYEGVQLMGVNPVTVWLGEGTQGGQLKVTATYGDLEPAAGWFTILDAGPQGINFTPYEGEIESGATLQLKAEIFPEGGDYKVIWTSEDETLATVSETGLVTSLYTATDIDTVVTICCSIEGYEHKACGEFTLLAAEAPAGIVYDLDGGKVLPANNEELYALLKAYYPNFAQKGRSDQTIENAATFFNANTDKMMTDETSAYKWLGDYLLPYAEASGKTPLDNAGWRWGLRAFLEASNGVYTGKYTSFDCTEAGKPENWQAACADVVFNLPTSTADLGYGYTWDFLLPSVVKEGYDFKGWKDAAGNVVTSIPANTEAGTYTAQWEAKQGTGLENAGAEQVNVRKVFENGNVYIIRDGVKYTITGIVVE